MVERSVRDIQSLFLEIQPDPEWSFAGLSQAHTTYGTHGYHRYPAKFIPQLAAKLITLYTREGNTVLDPFMGSGTTLVEAKRLKRPSLGIDINPVAHLIAQAKVQAFPPTELHEAIHQLKATLMPHTEPTLFGYSPLPVTSRRSYPERLHYWFSEKVLTELQNIEASILSLEERFHSFFLCGLSHILRNVSYWHDRSVKPTRKLDKKLPPVLTTFWHHIHRMERGNAVYYAQLQAENALDTPAIPLLADARTIPLPDNSVHCVITSPPYVTSYEYADLHQLSALWFGWTNDLRSLRKEFIGTASRNESNLSEIKYSPTANQIVRRLLEADGKKAVEVSHYFHDIMKSLDDMKRVLVQGGFACIVIGNTTLSGVEIQNAQVFAEMGEALGLSLHEVIMREIPSKILPQTRDKATGKFTVARKADFLAYPTEYIVVLRK